MLVGRPVPVAADSTAPSIYGWWSQASVAGPDPSSNVDVPPDGMLVQNAATGLTPAASCASSCPLAVAALQFSLSQGAVADTLTLNITGHSVITQAPIACPATTAFKAEEGGPWSDAPTYDCTHPVTGVVNAASTAVQFPMATLAKSDSLAVVVLAGGPADRIPFTKPGPDALSEKVAVPPTPSGGVTPPSEPVTVPFPATVPLPVPGSVIPPPTSANAGVTALAPPSSPPTVAASGTSATATTQSQPVGGGLVGTLTVGLLFLVILYWTEGFGAVRLRTSLASRRLKR
jgi:hypothetical protein